MQPFVDDHKILWTFVLWRILNKTSRCTWSKNLRSTPVYPRKSSVAQVFREAQVVLSANSALTTFHIVLTNSVEWLFGLAERNTHGKLKVINHFHIAIDIEHNHSSLAGMFDSLFKTCGPRELDQIDLAKWTFFNVKTWSLHIIETLQLAEYNIGDCVVVRAIDFGFMNVNNLSPNCFSAPETNPQLSVELYCHSTTILLLILILMDMGNTKNPHPCTSQHDSCHRSKTKAESVV